ncbi:MAG: divalent-cation tolerance protein CutA [Chitinophagales bacterium]|nr:divalent-cation tolerance protein CutA [Chitinophagales bacterium]
MNKICFTYVPFPSQEAAAQLVKALLDMHLIACGNIIPSRSHYSWENACQEEDEFIAMLKTSTRYSEKLMTFIEQNHPYDLPAILQWEAVVNENYYVWIEAETAIHRQ